MLRFVYLIITAAVRLAVMAVVTYFVAKGDLKMADVSPYINEAINVISIALTGAVMLGWAAWEKWIHGLVPNSPHLPFNIPGMLQSPKQVTAVINPDGTRK